MPQLDPDDPRPLGILDVDGPFNVFDADPGHPDVYAHDLVYRDTRTGHLRHTTVRLHRGHPGMLDRLAESFQLVWGTAWEHNANASGLAEALGLPELPVVEWGGDRFTGRRGNPHRLHWKTAKVSEYAAAARRPFVWIDDEHSGADARWLTEQGHQCALVGTDPAEGMADRHVLGALHWAATLAQTRVA